MNTSCKFQINQINRERVVPSFIIKPINILMNLYMSVTVEAIRYPKINILTLILLEKSNISGKFNYIKSLQDHKV